MLQNHHVLQWETVRQENIIHHDDADADDDSYMTWKRLYNGFITLCWDQLGSLLGLITCHSIIPVMICKSAEISNIWKNSSCHICKGTQSEMQAIKACEPCLASLKLHTQCCIKRQNVILPIYNNNSTLTHTL